MDDMITEFHDYQNGYIGLVHLELDDLPPTISVSGYELLLKSEFHISLICAKRIAALIDADNAQQIEAEIVEDFKVFVETTPLTDYSLTGTYRLVRRDERVTIVALATVPDLDTFFSQLEATYQTNLPLQPTHITIYTLQPDAGIGILSDEQMEHDSELVAVPFSFTENPA